MSKLFKIIPAFAIILIVTSVALADTPIVSYFEPIPVLGSYFGSTVIGMNDWVIVGVPYRDLSQVDTDIGRVYVYQEANALHLHTIENPDPDVGDRFGYALAPFYTGDPTQFIVGVPYDDDGERDAGIVYIYSASSGNLVRTIHNPDPDESDLFGWAVSYVFGGMILVGAPGENSNTGIAYLFNANTGELLQTLHNPDPDAFDNFGMAVVGSNRAIVGAPDEDLGGIDAGAVYVFDPSNGNLLVTLQNPSAGSSSGGTDDFGKALAIAVLYTGNYAVNIVVGAPGEDAGATDVGVAYLFDEVSGDLLRTFNNPDPDEDDTFGAAVAASFPNYVLVSSPKDDTQANNAGAAYLFDTNTGLHLRTFNKQNADAGDELGNALGLGSAGFLVGVQLDDTEDSNAGAVYLFQSEFSAHTYMPIIFR